MKKKYAFFVLVLSFSFGVGAQQDNDEWIYQEDIDPMTDENSSWAGLPKSHNEMVVVRCSGANYDIIVGVGDYIGSSEAYPVTYRIDDKEAVGAGRWSPSTEGTMVFVPNRLKDDLLEELKSSSKIAFQVTNHRGTQHTAVFPLHGSARAIKKLKCVD